MHFLYTPLSDAPQCPDGIVWINEIFADCVDTNVKLIGFIVGFVSLILWLLPTIPQLYQNYRLKQCDGLSIAFLMFWLFGDISNMAGSVLTNQQPIQKIIGFYYVLQDVTLLAQYLYYSRIYHRGKRARRVAQAFAAGASMILASTLIVFVVLAFQDVADTSSHIKAIISGSWKTHQSSSNFVKILQNYSDYIGYALGTFAALSYFSGRIPQMIMNHKRQSCEGLSLTMLFIIMPGNLTYGLAVLMESTGADYFWRHLPWLAGSMGCCFIDTFMIYQCYKYRGNKQFERLDEEDDNDQNEVV
ncbi:hypothetical protein QR680_003930 [Steinernema hermaphroditum]|uniref:PQ-loop repeat-containing protein n=1 Tax=Steinernema hermaphroditum TaxID=289476 RepID=A0AA39LT72_9BILA|nr:hypothetical protein QR680_003930 [Steinernema hermaphroditum]